MLLKMNCIYQYYRKNEEGYLIVPEKYEHTYDENKKLIKNTFIIMCFFILINKS